MTKELQKTSSDSKIDLLELTLQSLTEGITGIASSERKNWALSIGHIIQRFRGHGFVNEIRGEWKKYRDKGRIKEDYCNTAQHLDCMQELFASLDQDLPDTQRLDVLKRIFIVASTESQSDREGIVPQQFMSLARKLSSGEISVLHGTCKLSYTDFPSFRGDQNISADQWIDAVRRTSNLIYAELVVIHETELIKKGLLSSRTYSDGSGIAMAEHFRLTRLGKAFCDFILAYDSL